MILLVSSITMMVLACARSVQQDDTPLWRVPGQGAPQPIDVGLTTQVPFLLPTRDPNDPILTPTPDTPHALPAMRTKPEQYVIQAGDTLGTLAQRYGVSLVELVAANELSNPNLLEVGQTVTIPVPTPQGMGPDFKIIPDSELVYSPANAYFDIESFIQNQDGYLAQYTEEVDDRKLTGAQIVAEVARDFSVNPRLLLAVLQYQSGWLTEKDSNKLEKKYPIGVRDTWREGLYYQLSWAANNLNRGYYLWRVNGAATWLLGDGTVVPIASTINAGTAGVQHMFAALYGREGWERAISAEGLQAVYNTLFGYPFDLAIEPLLPPGMSQPVLQLPFEKGIVWAFTGGPHGGWGDGSAWAALDFAPPAEALGCIPSNDWVVAVADGLILRAENGAVVQDLDGDGLEQTGWTILYMHVEKRSRVAAGTYLKTGEQIGHPSCEGGISSGTHVHIARRYNGEWIPADQTLPFVMDDWVSRGAGIEYDGYLERNGHSIEAWEGRSKDNAIQR